MPKIIDTEHDGDFLIYKLGLIGAEEFNSFKEIISKDYTMYGADQKHIEHKTICDFVKSRHFEFYRWLKDNRIQGFGWVNSEIWSAPFRFSRYEYHWGIGIHKNDPAHTLFALRWS